MFMQREMGKTKLLNLICAILALLSIALVNADDPYRYFTWTATYGQASPLGTPQQVILINDQFPGPTVDVVTNDNIVLNLINKLDEPLLITWNGIKQRKNSWQDGVLGTNCPIPPNSNYNYTFQAKDQIGTYTYFPSTAMHKASGGFGGFNVNNRVVIPLPYPKPDVDFTLLIGDWYKAGHKALRETLDSGKLLPPPDGIHINGHPSKEAKFEGIPGKLHRVRVSNVGLTTSFNFRIEGHKMKLVEVEGSHVQNNIYDSIDVHVGQSIAVLVTLDQPPTKEYIIAASTRYTPQVLTVIGCLHYKGSTAPPPAGGAPEPPPATEQLSMEQARSFKWNLSANAARPNIQGSFKYGTVNITKKFLFESSAPVIGGKLRCAVNGISYTNPDTPLKLADYFMLPGIFTPDPAVGHPAGAPPKLGTAVLPADSHDFVEIVFQNTENTMQSWHLDGYDFWVVGFGSGKWTEASRQSYNLVDALTRHTTQVYPNGWTAILASLDNQGMWNLRSAIWDRRYLGQELYVRVFNEEKSLTQEYELPPQAILCGKAVGAKKPA